METPSRILLKLSGEVLAGQSQQSYEINTLTYLAEEIASARALGVEIAIVIGGGNLFRGLSEMGQHFDRTIGDQMGMLATVMNALAVAETLQNHHIPATVFTSTFLPGIAPKFNKKEVLAQLVLGKVVVFGGGTGNPFFTTDTAAALRAAEIEADCLVKATKVDGIYSADPMKDPTAKRFDRIRYQEVLAQNLKVMDLTAISFCMENKIPVKVFNINHAGSLAQVIAGKPVGTTVY